MKLRILIYLIAIGFCASAQLPVAKVDINMEGRSESEVNQEGYTPWYMARIPSSSITVSGVTFELRATAPKVGTSFRTSWAKAYVQSPNFMRLVGDGVRIDPDSLVAHPKIPAAFEMHITGLPKGKHMLQTYHNTWEDTTKYSYAPMNVYLNNNIIFSKVKRSIKVSSTSEATLLMIELNVEEAGQEMVLKFEADSAFVPTSGKTADINVQINAFELNTSDVSKLSYDPTPVDGEYHVDADSTKFVILKWNAAINNYTKTHTLYFDTDSTIVADATSANTSVCIGEFPVDQTSWKAEGLYNMNTYYWRVDETDSTGLTTKGKVWRFRIRHDAFPDAEGYGRYAIGGRGGNVVYVTNLKDSGEGSFRYAVENIEGPRTILFAVSGLITLNDRLVINDDFVTVAGQTAPGKGICFRWAALGFTGDDLIIQNLRNRVGYGITFDGMGLTGSQNSIVDHCSVSWSIDEGFSSRSAKNITVQRTMVAEALNDADHEVQNKEHGYAGSIGGDIGSFHHMLLAHCNGRNWSMAGGLDGTAAYAGRLDLFNTVVYNWGSRATDGGAHEVNFVNNYYKKGKATTLNQMLSADLEGTGTGTQSYYTSGNVMENLNGSLACDGTDPECGRRYTTSNGQVLNWDVFRTEPFFPSLAKINTAKDAYKLVLSDVGCTQPQFDDHDLRMVNETLTGTYTVKGYRTGKLGFPDHEKDAGYWEAYPGYNRASSWDTDLDGLPDWWEKAKGLNPNSAKDDFSDSNADIDKDGYTNLEDYLYWMSKPHYFSTKGEKLEIDLSKYTKGFTKSPAFTTSDAVNGTVSLSAGTSTAIFNTSNEGLAGFKFTVTDAEGTQLTQCINIYVGEIPADEAFSYTYYLERANTTLITVDKTSSNKQISNGSIQSQIDVFPNPVTGLLNVNFRLQQAGKSIISVVSLTGQTMIQRNEQVHQGVNGLKIDVSNLTNGVYILKVQNENGIRTKQFIKQ